MRLNRLLVLCAISGGLLPATGFCQTAAANLTPFRIEETLKPRFPAVLLAEAITRGDVWIMVSIDADGKLSDALVTRYTHRALANEAMFDLSQWRYEPARDHGNPVAARGELHFQFEASGAVVSLDPTSTMKEHATFAYRPVYVTTLCRPNELDQAPTPIRTVTPNIPGDPASWPAGSRVIIEFIIDEHGQPRMPVLVSTTDKEFSEEAARALVQWQFTPPTRCGEPVSVTARQEFLVPARS